MDNRRITCVPLSKYAQHPSFRIASLRHITFLLLVIALSAFPTWPQESQEQPLSPDQNPVIAALSPNSGSRLTLVGIVGGPFSANPAENSVTIGGVIAPSRTLSTSQIEFLVPESTAVGVFPVAVTTRGLVSAPTNFTVIRPPIPYALATPNYNSEINTVSVLGLNLRTLSLQARAAMGDDWVYPLPGALAAGRGIFPSPYFAGLNLSSATPGASVNTSSICVTPMPGRVASGRDTLTSDLSGTGSPSQVYSATANGLSSFANSFANFQSLPPGSGSVIYSPIYSPNPSYNARASGPGNPLVRSDVFLLTTVGVADFVGGSVRFIALPANAGDPVGPLVVRRNPLFGTVSSAGTSPNPFIDGLLLSTTRGMVEIAGGAANFIAFPPEAGQPVSAPVFRGNPNFNPLMTTGVTSVGDPFPIRPEILVATTNGLISIVGGTPTFIPIPPGAGRVVSAPICQLNSNFNLFPGTNPSLADVALFAGPVLLTTDKGVVIINDGSATFVALPPGAGQLVSPPLTAPNPSFNAFFPITSAGSPRPFSSSILLAASNGLVTINGLNTSFVPAPLEAGQLVSPPAFQINPTFSPVFNPASPSGAVQPFGSGALIAAVNGLLRFDGGRTDFTPLPPAAGMPTGAPIPITLATGVTQILLPLSNGLAVFGSGSPTVISTPAGVGRVVGPPLRTSQGQLILACSGGVLVTDGSSSSFVPSPAGAGEIISTPIVDPNAGGSSAFLLTTTAGFLRFANTAFNFFPLPGTAGQHVASKLILTAAVAAQFRPPIANAGPDRTVNEGDNVVFDGSGSAAPDGTIVSYQWDFGDGSTASGPFVNHIFADNGTYLVRLTVTDNNGLTGAALVTVTVRNVAPIVNAGPDRTVGVGETAAFQGSFTDPGTRDTFTIRWDFGDGSSVTGTLTPTHAYSSAGVFTVVLTVTDKDGASGIGSARVTVTDTIAPQVNVIAPAGGETLLPGSIFTVRWSSFDNVGVVSHEVRLSSDGGISFATRLDSGLSGSAQSFDWFVPTNLSITTGRIQVIARDAAGNTGSGLSGFFTVRDSIPPQVTVISPSSGQSINAGSIFTIRWSSTDNVGVVSQTILLSTDGGGNFSTVIASNRPGSDSSFDWFVPGSLFSNSAKIRIMASDAAGNSGSGDSSIFSIRDTVPPTVSISSPQSGQSFSPGTTLSIQWTASDNVGIASQDILLSTDGGFNFNFTIVLNLQGDQRFYSWNIPSNLASSTAQIRIVVRDFSGLTASAQTGNFSIRDTIPPSISLTAPLGGEIIDQGSTYLIRWNSFDNIAVTNHEIQFSSNGGFSFSTIGTTGAQQSFSWSVPNITTSQGRIRVIARDAANNSGQDTSGNFTIRDNTPPFVSIIAPAGGEQLTAGQVFLVRWTSSDNVGVVSQDVFLSTNGGASFSTQIQTNLSGNQTQLSWTVPSVSTSQARVRVVARDAAGLVGQADSNLFSIIADNRPPTVNIEAPGDEDTVSAGSNFLIRWRSSDNFGVVGQEVQFSGNGGGSFGTIASLGGSANSFNWSVPNIVINNARIRVIARDAAGNEGRDTTGNFRIVDRTPPVVSLQRPSAGEVLTGSTTYTIRWSSSDNIAVASHDLLVSTNGGASFSSIQTGLSGGQTQFNWTVPNINTAQARIRVIARDAANNNSQDTSGNFTINSPIQPPSVRVISPNGGEVLIGGRDFLIQWISSSSSVVSSDILLSTDGGATFPSPIRSGLPGSATSFNWTVPNNISTARARVRVIVRDSAGNTGSDDSDANFTIQSSGGGGGLNALVAVGNLTIVNGLPNSPSLNGSVGTQSGTRGVVVAPSGQFALAFGTSNSVQILSGLGGGSPFVSGSFNSGGVPQAVVISPDSSFAVVANAVGGQTTISIVNGLPNSPSVSTPSGIQINSTTRDMAISPNGNSVVLSLPGMQAVVAIQNLRPGPPVVRPGVRVGVDPAGVAIGADGDTVYVAVGGINNVVILKGLASSTGLGLVGVANTGPGSRPTGLRLSADGSTMVVSNSGNNTATIFRVSAESVIERGTVATGSNPVGVAISRDGQSAIISNTGDRTLSVILNLGSAPSAGPRLGPSGSLATQPDALESLTYFP